MATSESRRSRKGATPATTMSDTPRLKQLGRFLLLPAHRRQGWRGLTGVSAGGVSAPAPKPGDRRMIRGVGQRQCPAHHPTPPTQSTYKKAQSSESNKIQRPPSMTASGMPSPSKSISIPSAGAPSSWFDAA